MNIREAMHQAMTTGDLPRVRQIVDRLRAGNIGPWADGLRGPGIMPCPPFDYADLLAFAQRAVPGLTKQAWETMLEQIDDMEVE